MRLALVLFVALSLGSCGPKKDDDKDDTSSGEEQEEQAPDVTDLIVEAKASEVMLATSTALNSASDGDQFGALDAQTLSPGTLSIEEGEGSGAGLTDEPDGPSDANPNCSGNGEPYGSDGQELESGDLGYILKTFYCLLNDKESPDVVLGAIGIARGFVCMAERQEDFDYSAEGTEVSVSYDNVLAHEDAQACFPEEVLANSEEDAGGEGMAYGATITGYLLDSGPWTHRINIVETASDDDDDGPEEPKDTYFVVNKTQAAYKRGGISASLDFEAGILRFENIEVEHGRHTRFFVKGDLGDDGKFSTVTEMQAIQGQVGGHALTVKGSSEDGYTYSYFDYDCSDCTEISDEESGSSGEMIKVTGGTWRHRGSECLGTDGACSKDDGIVFEADTDTPFIATNNSELVEDDFEPWIKNHEPLCFDSVTSERVPSGDCQFIGSE